MLAGGLPAPGQELVDAARRMIGDARSTTAVSAAVEEQLAQNYRVGGNELSAFEAIDQEVGRCVEFETGKLFGDQVQAFRRATVVVRNG